MTRSARPSVFPFPPHLEGLDRFEAGKPIAEVQRELGLARVVKLASNENPLGPSPLAVAAAREALAGVNRYPDPQATELRAALAAHLGVPVEMVLAGNGSVEILDLAARALLGPGDNAVISEHAFVRFRQIVAAHNHGARLVPMRGFTHDLEAMANAIDARTRLVFVANPNNPTGTWNRRAEVEALVSALPAGCLLVLDEAYFEYAREGAAREEYAREGAAREEYAREGAAREEYARKENPSADYPDGIELVRRGAPVLVTRTFSKAYGLGGLRAGYAVAAPEVLDAILVIREAFGTSVVAQAGARAALADHEHVRRTLELNRAERPRLAAALAQRGYHVLPSLANFVTFDTGRPGREVFKSLLAHGVIVRPLEPYRMPAFLRVSVGTAEENDAFIQALDAVMGRQGA